MYDVWYYTYATWMWVKHSTHASAEAAWAEARRYRSANFLGQRQIAVTETVLRPANTLPGAAFMACSG